MRGDGEVRKPEGIFVVEVADLLFCCCVGADLVNKTIYKHAIPQYTHWVLHSTISVNGLIQIFQYEGVTNSKD